MLPIKLLKLNSLKKILRIMGLLLKKVKCPGARWGEEEPTAYPPGLHQIRNLDHLNPRRDPEVG